MSELLGPMQAVLITSRAEIEQFGKKIVKDDVESVFWHMPFSKEEMVYAIAIHKGKHIVNLIKVSKVFVVNFLSSDDSKIVHKCNLMHGQHIDKFSELKLLKLESSAIECPLIKEACAYMECNVIDILEYKDYAVFIAKIINSNVKYACKRLFHLKDDKYTTTKD